MSVIEPSQNRLAVLIDADNAQPSITEGLLSEVAKYGVANVKRIYGDWSTPSSRYSSFDIRWVRMQQIAR